MTAAVLLMPLRRLVVERYGFVPSSITRSELRALHDKVEEDRRPHERWDSRPASEPVLVLADDGTATIV